MSEQQGSMGGGDFHEAGASRGISSVGTGLEEGIIRAGEGNAINDDLGEGLPGDVHALPQTECAEETDVFTRGEFVH